ncbi:hypothetical protein N7513_007754 [Penicillium frequentans]|nr:hypothetical protein N7513_007754 [Penicillium glabrum]
MAKDVDRGLRRLNLGIAFMLAASATSGYNASQINSLLVLPEFAIFLKDLSANAEGLIIAAVSLGSFLTFIPASYVADRLGRRPCVAIGATLVILASVIQVAVEQPWVFFGARIVTGAGVGFSQTAAPLLIAEAAHPRQRSVLTGLYNAIWFCGSITAAGIAFSTLGIQDSWSWRVPCMLQVLFPLFQLVGLFIIPESPRWLVSKDRKGEARAMLVRYHGNGDLSSALVQEEYDQICSSISAEADLKACSGWSAFLSSRGDVHRLSICILMGFMQEWTGNGVTSYYLPPILASVGIKNAAHQAAVNISLQVWNLFFAVGGASTSDRYGRPYDFAYMPLFIAYPAEILPFQLRAKGLAITLTTDSLACFFNQYVNPVAFAALRWKYFLLYVGCLVVFLGVVYFLFPETQGRSLEDVARIFEDGKILQVMSPVDSEGEGESEKSFEKTSFAVKSEL